MRKRLTAMVDTNDGFEIAERDLELRGAGDFLGLARPGMPTFRLIDLVAIVAARPRAARATLWFSDATPDAAAVLPACCARGPRASS